MQEENATIILIKYAFFFPIFVRNRYEKFTVQVKKERAWEKDITAT